MWRVRGGVSEIEGKDGVSESKGRYGVSDERSRVYVRLRADTVSIYERHEIANNAMKSICTSLGSFMRAMPTW